MSKMPQLSEKRLDEIRHLVARSMVRWEWMHFSYYKNDFNGLWQVMPVREGIFIDGQPGIQAYAGFHPGNARRIDGYVLFGLHGMRDVSVAPIKFNARMLPAIPSADSASFKEVTGRLAPQPEV